MGRGRPKKFDPRTLINLFDLFCQNIIDEGYTRIPSQTEFCRWLSTQYEKTDRKTVYNALNKYFPTIKKEFEQIQSDTIAQGGMVGAYKHAMAIFALKNWCKWTDNVVEDENEGAEQIIKSIQELTEVISSSTAPPRRVEDYE